jgi:hypothetical protein
MIGRSGPSGADAAIWAVAVDVEHDEGAVLQHGFDIGTTPPLRCGLDQRPSLIGVDDHSRGSRNVGDHRVFQVHNDMRVGSDVIDPVPGSVRTWHSADEQHATLLVQEDLDPPAPSGPSSCCREIDGLTTKQRSADAFIPKPSSVAHATMIAVHGRDTPHGR